MGIAGPTVHAHANDFNLHQDDRAAGRIQERAHSRLRHDRARGHGTTMKYCPVCEKTYGDDVAVCAADGTGLRAQAVPEDPFIGRTMKGRYRVLSKIGAGGMGAVYLAEQISVDRKVALKLLHADFARNDEFVRRFRQEARLAAALNHRSVVTIHEFDQAEDGSLFIAMEYVEGKSLAEVIKSDGPLEVERAVRLGVQIAEGLAAAHRGGVIHRDVKPQNIMVVGADEVKLMDFGIARLRDTGGPALTRSGVVMGTPYYMAPEQIQGGEITERTDIYAFGIVLYEMLTGVVPFAAPAAAAVLAKHLHEAPAPPRTMWPEIPPAVERVVLQALEKDPNARQHDMREVAAALRGGATQAQAREAQILSTRSVGEEVAEARTAATRPLQPEVPRTMAVSATVVAEGPRPGAKGRWKLFAGVGAIFVALVVFVGGVLYYVNTGVRAPSRPVPQPPAAPSVPAPPSPPTGPTAPSPGGPQPEVFPPPMPPPSPGPAQPPALEKPTPRPGGRSKSARPRPPEPDHRPDTGAAPGALDAAGIRGLVEQQLRSRGLLKGSGPEKDLGVTVDIASNGIVTLKGVVRSRKVKGETIQVAKGVPGVTDVRDQINALESWGTDSQ